MRARGIDAWSCDILPTEGDPRWHFQDDCQRVLHGFWDLIIMHVPCTAMGVCGNRTYGVGKLRHAERIAAIDWTLETVDLALRAGKHVALENPASVIFPYLRDVYDCGVDVQYVQPWQHGHPEQKKTGLALFDLPRLTDTDNVYDHMMTLPRTSVSGCFSCRREPIAARSAPASLRDCRRDGSAVGRPRPSQRRVRREGRSMSSDTLALIAGGCITWLVVAAFTGVLIGRFFRVSDPQHHRGLRHEHGSRHSDPQRAGRLSVGGEISDVHSDFSRISGGVDHA
ncbi:hypothetical protein AB5I41_31295 [Sphingomonas sp. MMS24-JH45]